MPCSGTAVSLRGEVLHIPGALVFIAATEGVALDLRALVFLGSTRLITVTERVFGRLPPPGHCTDIRLKHIHSL